jgi:hypothetical protein
MAPAGNGGLMDATSLARLPAQGRAGFNATERGIHVAARFGQWQSAGDERMWKVIVSPEFGDRVDLGAANP